MANEFRIKNGLIVDQGTSQISGSLNISGSTNLSGSLYVNTPNQTMGQFVGNQNGYVEFSVRNTNTGISASGDIAVYADNGTALNNYIDMGINNSGMSPTYYYGGTDFGDALDAYLYNVGGNLRIGNATSQAPYSQSLYLFSNPTATPNIWITGSQVAIGKSSGSINGTFDVNGNTIITGSLNVSNGITGSHFGTSSYSTQALSASWAPYQTSASYASTASYAPSYVLNSSTSSMLSPYVLTSSTGSMTVLSSSFAISSSRSISSSYALSASYAPSSPAFPYTGSAQITGSLGVTGSLTVSGSIFSTADATISNMTVGRGAANITSNTVVGNNSLTNNTTGYSNVAVGLNALTKNTTGYSNVAVGPSTLSQNTIGNFNTALGDSALANSVGGDNNIAIGYFPLVNTVGGSCNIAIGFNAGAGIIDNNFNTLIGYNTGLYITTGESNILIGDENRYSPDGTAFNGSRTLSISKADNDYGLGLPHIWAPTNSSAGIGANQSIISVQVISYSSMFVEYTIEDENGSLRAGYIKSIWNSDGSSIKWTEDTTDSIGNTSNYIFDMYYDSGNEVITLRLTNNSGDYRVYINVTSRLLGRPYHP
jgi:hypothetical protein